MKAVIISKFDEMYDRDPFSFLQDQRAAQGLPTRDQPPETSNGHVRGHDYEQ